MSGAFHRFATKAADLAGSPWAFALALLLVIGWAVTGPRFGWSEQHSLAINTATTIVTFLLVFLIQNTQNTNEAAMNKKLDGLIDAIEQADNRLIGIERE